METLARISTFRHTTDKVPTQRATDFVDVTSRIQSLVRDTGLYEGLVNVRCWQPLSAVVIDDHEPVIGETALLRVGTPICVDVADGRLDLPRGQRIYLVDLDGPRTLPLSMLAVGDGE